MDLHSDEPVAYGSLTKEQFDEEILKGIEDINKERIYTRAPVRSSPSPKLRRHQSPSRRSQPSINSFLPDNKCGILNF